MHTIIRTFSLVFFSLIYSECLASVWPKSAAEFATLPAYCLARIGPGKGLNVPESEVQKWKKALGPGFIHVHHFCAGLNTLNVINRGVPTERELNSVLGEFSYTQHHAGKDFPLQPKISVEKGKILLKLDRVSEALTEFQLAIQLKPTYSPAYAELSDYYVKNGLLDKAEIILKEGLKHSPNSKSLKRRLNKLN